MNEQFDSSRHGLASAEQVNGHAVDTELAETGCNVGPAQAFRYSTNELADHLRIRLLASRGQGLRTEKSQTNEFMAVFSHELRNSLGAIRSALQIASLARA